MRVFTTLPQEDLRKVGPAALAIEADGYTGVSTQENRHEPFLSLAVAGAATKRIELHTGVAIACARKLRDRGVIGASERVVVVSSANALKFTDFKVAYHASRLPDVPAPVINVHPPQLP